MKYLYFIKDPAEEYKDKQRLAKHSCRSQVCGFRILIENFLNSVVRKQSHWSMNKTLDI